MSTENRSSSKDKKITPPPAYRVFISSTNDEEMKKYREAVMDALRNADAVSRGMERFTASTEPVIDRCYEELQECQFCICLVGLRYGSIYRDSGLSYSELEFNKADELGIPVLVFVQEGSFDSTKIDVENINRLEAFKKKLQNSANNRLMAHFKNPEDLRDLVTRAMKDEFDRKERGRKDSSNESAKEDYLTGASVYKNFIRLPARYAGKKVRLRVRVDGVYGSWMLKEELFDAFGFEIGNALFLNDLFVLGVDYGDIGSEARHIDLFAGGEGADWFLREEITKGDIFEGDFELAFKYAKNIAGKSKVQIGASNAYIAKLIFLGKGQRIQSASTAGELSSRLSDEENPDAMRILSQLFGNDS